MLEVRLSKQFRKSFKKVKSYKGFKQEVFEYVIYTLSARLELPHKFHDHPLVGNHKDKRECHLAPDILLIYRVEEDAIYSPSFGTKTLAFRRTLQASCII